MVIIFLSYQSTHTLVLCNKYLHREQLIRIRIYDIVTVNINRMECIHIDIEHIFLFGCVMARVECFGALNLSHSHHR